LHENGEGGTAVSSPHNKQSHQGHPQPGPIQLGGKMAEHMVQVAYNAQHKLPWHWPVPAYLVTKGLAAGLYMLLALGWLLDWFPFDGLTAVAAGFLCLLFMGLTTGLLVYDLDRPERFLYILLRPQWRSWLARGAVLLIGFTLLLGGWWLWETAVFMGWLSEVGIVALRPWLLAAGLPLAGGVAIYTAFLFAQAEGRDLWQSPLLPAHLVVQALLLGSGLVLLLGLLLPLAPDLTATAQTWFVLLLLVDLFMLLVGEFAIPHASEVAVRAADEIRNGRYRYLFWGGAVGLGHILPLLFTRMFPAEPAIWGLCALFVLIGIYLYEYVYVMAPQEIPNS
jgi:formate-dependent nitrite reductase membrane component NrfD